MAIEDSVVLARCLKRTGSLSRNLHSFVAERYPRTTSITNGSLRFGRFGQWEGRWTCWIRDQLLGVFLPVVGAKSLLQYGTHDVGPLTAAAPIGV
jgi:2-polyprenyl-6-methoxyphenol hydroxylase-like FAD-dependent oxidoreductase